MQEITRSQTIALLLLKEQKISRDDIKYLSKYHSGPDRKLSEDEILSAPRHTLTQGQKAYQTWLLSRGR